MAQGDGRLIARVLKQGLPYWQMILLFMVSTAASGALMGYLISQLSPFIALIGKTESAQGAGDVARMAADLRHLGWLLLALAPIGAVAAYVSWWSGQWIANQTMRALRNRLLGHLVHLELAYHTQLSRGDLLTRLTTDLTSCLRVQQYLYGKLLQRPLESLGIIASLWWIDWRIGAAVTAALLPVLAILVPVVGRTRARSKKARDTLAANLGVMEQITSGIRVIKAMGSAEREQERYADANRKLFNDNLRLARTRAQSDAITAGSVFGLAGAGIVIGAFLFAAGLIRPGALFTALGALARLISSLREVVRTWGDMQEQLPSVERVYALLDRPSAVIDAPNAPPCPRPTQAIRLENVRFRYAPDADEVLCGVDLDIPIGQTIALVGTSGGGKSTILDLLPRLHDVTGGRITIDGQDLRAVQHASLIAHCAIVSQDSFLFNDTVLNNLRYGRPDATREQIETAAKRAHVHEAILCLEGGLGYETPVGDRGSRLSGGQRQRVAIARALLRDAPLLFLDEPTSALDAASEHHVQQALAELMRGRTTVVVAHRLATIQHADRIYVLAGRDHPGHGTVIEAGTHAELVARGGAYAELVRLQTLG